MVLLSSGAGRRVADVTAVSRREAGRREGSVLLVVAGSMMEAGSSVGRRKGGSQLPLRNCKCGAGWRLFAPKFDIFGCELRRWNH